MQLEEEKIDIKNISEPHYLLEAGKNMWRLSDTFYSNPKTLTTYAIGLLYNNTLNGYTESQLESLEVQMRLHYLFYKYTDENLDIDMKIEKLVEHFLVCIEKIEDELQEDYKLSQSKEENSKIEMINRLALILKDKREDTNV